MSDIEDFYTLTPLQAGMLFHSLEAPNSPAYIEQFSFKLNGELNVEAFTDAWRRILTRHSVLRTSFVWEELDEPIQVVHREIEVPLSVFDYRNLHPDDQNQRIEDLMMDDRARGFDLRVPPLIRLALFRTASNEWRLVWTCHHIILDGWSMAILIREISECYAALSANRAPSLQPVRPWRDYLVWLRQQDVKAAERYWRKTLAGLRSAPLGIESQQISTGFDETVLTIDAANTACIRRLACDCQVTLNTIVTAAWALLLSRYSGEREVVFGSVVSGRPPALAGVESMVGLFINTLAAQVRVVPDLALATWFRQLQNDLASMRQFQHTSLAEIQRWVGLAPGSALLQSVLVFENYPASRPANDEGRGFLSVSADTTHERSHYPLTLAVSPGEEMKFRLAFDQSLIDRETAERTLRHLATLLGRFCRGGGQLLRSLHCVSDEEVERIAREFNSGSGSDCVTESGVHTLFEKSVRERPEAIALGEAGISYAELNARSNELAHFLYRRIGTAQPVLIALEDEVLQVVAILATIKAGCHFCCLDIGIPSERVRHIIREFEPVCLLVDEATSDKARAWLSDSEMSPALYLLDHMQSPRDLSNDRSDPQQRYPSSWRENLDLPSNASSTLCVVFTSGSSGFPKGIVQNHGNFAQFTKWFIDRFGLRPGVRMAQWANISYDASYAEIFAALCSGATLHTVPGRVRTDAAKVVDWLESRRISVFQTVPSFCREMVRWAEGRRALTHLTHLLLAGQSLSGELVERWRSSFGAHMEVVNLYGPTECILATHHTVSNEPGAGAVPIGQPIPGRCVRVIDADGNLCPIGITGEICISGPYLAPGYFKRPKETAASFTSEHGAARSYHTGDLGRWLPDGNLEFRGRRDHRIKIRGVRIELEEIDRALEQHPSVEECAACAVEILGELQVVAFVVARSEVREEELQSYAIERLPTPATPARFLFSDTLPRTSSGKVDRPKLASSLETPPETGRSLRLPITDNEKLIAFIWSEVLRVPTPAADDNFYHLGGHSLLAAQVVSRVRDALGLSIPLSRVFQYPTMSAFAAFVDEQMATATRPVMS